MKNLYDLEHKISHSDSHSILHSDVFMIIRLIDD